MTDADALALCVFEEANLEPDDGVAAVARVVLNRAALHYQSDGTIQGAIFHPASFSWTQYEMEDGRYAKVAFTSQDIAARAARLLATAKGYTRAWTRCSAIAAQVQAGTFAGPDYAKITPDTVLYDNLALAAPVWATPDKLVCVIGNHSFFRN